MVYDGVVVGGGIVGASLALALSQQNYKVLLIEQTSASPLPDDFQARTLALSYTSMRIYEALKLSDKLKSRAVPIHKVLVNMKGQYGSCRLDCFDENVDALGHVVSAHELERILYEALAEQKVEILRPATICQRDCAPDGWQLKLSTLNKTISCKLLIASDGVTSHLRQEQSISCLDRDYDHYAVLSNLKIASMQPFTAIERFLPFGAIALLPWQENIMTCVWTTHQKEAQDLKQISDDEFLHRCQEQLGKRVGLLQAVSKRIIFPLRMQIAEQQTSARFLLMGNAAHSLHPIAAQGLNLSLRDIWQIRSQIIKSKQTHCDIGSPSFLQEYMESRKPDQARVIFATDKIARFMSKNNLPSWLRAAGITMFDCLSPLKRKFTRFGMGLS